MYAGSKTLLNSNYEMFETGKIQLEMMRWILISGAGVVEMKFYTTVNVTDVRVHGTATRGEKIDVESYTFEGKLLQCEISWNIPHCNLVIWY